MMDSLKALRDALALPLSSFEVVRLKRWPRGNVQAYIFVSWVSHRLSQETAQSGFLLK